MNIANKYVFDPMAKKLVKPTGVNNLKASAPPNVSVPRRTTRSVTRAAHAMASAVKAGATHVKNTVRKSAAKPAPPGPPPAPSSPLTHNKITFVRQVPAYFMAFSGNRWDRGDAGHNKSDAALFQTKDRPLFAPDSPNFDLMRLFIEFKLGDTGNDPFDERTHVEEMNTATKSRAKVREQILDPRLC